MLSRFTLGIEEDRNLRRSPTRDVIQDSVKKWILTNDAALRETSSDHSYRFGLTSPGEVEIASKQFGEMRVSYEKFQLPADMMNKWFAELSDETDDTGEPAPSEHVIEEAKRIVQRLHDQLPADTDVYSMDGGKIAVELYGEAGYAFLLVCEPGGSSLCAVTVRGVSRWARYESSNGLPDNFVRDGIGDVRQRATVRWS